MVLNSFFFFLCFNPEAIKSSSLIIINKSHQVIFRPPDIPVTSFSCQDRPLGYYADVETNCQVYHMCGEGGRQYSYTCPNTTLFHQRMLICAHWYQVDCNRSEADYSANLLIGQRDKPFVDDYISSNLGNELQELKPTTNTRITKVLKQSKKSSTGMTVQPEFEIASSKISVMDGTDLDRSQSGSILSHSFNRLANIKPDERLIYKGSVRPKSTSVTEPTGAIQFQPTNVSFRSTIETPNSETILARTAPMTSSQPSQRTESAFKQLDVQTTSGAPTAEIDRPSRDLLPPLISEMEQTNTIELRLEDPRHALYIPRGHNIKYGTRNGSGDLDSTSKQLPENKPIVVTINLHGQTGFSSSGVYKEKLTQCNRCHPTFIIDKKKCSPCLLIS